MINSGLSVGEVQLKDFTANNIKTALDGKTENELIVRKILCKVQMSDKVLAGPGRIGQG